MSIYYWMPYNSFSLYCLFPFRCLQSEKRARIRIRFVGSAVPHRLFWCLMFWMRSVHIHCTIVRWTGSVSASHICTGHFSFSISFHKFCALHFVSDRRSTNAFILIFGIIAAGTNDNGDCDGSSSTRRKMWNPGKEGAYRTPPTDRRRERAKEWREHT